MLPLISGVQGDRGPWSRSIRPRSGPTYLEGTQETAPFSRLAYLSYGFTAAIAVVGIEFRYRADGRDKAREAHRLGAVRAERGDNWFGVHIVTMRVR
jgi:hypothetical protein